MELQSEGFPCAVVVKNERNTKEQLCWGLFEKVEGGRFIHPSFPACAYRFHSTHTTRGAKSVRQQSRAGSRLHEQPKLFIRSSSVSSILCVEPHHQRYVAIFQRAMNN